MIKVKVVCLSDRLDCSYKSDLLYSEYTPMIIYGV